MPPGNHRYHRGTFLEATCEDQSPVDFIYGHPIFRWVPVIWLKYRELLDNSTKYGHHGDIYALLGGFSVGRLRSYMSCSLTLWSSDPSPGLVLSHSDRDLWRGAADGGGKRLQLVNLFASHGIQDGVRVKGLCTRAVDLEHRRGLTVLKGKKALEC